MEEEGVSAYLDDFAVSDDPDSPITAGLFRLERGKKLTYTYTYKEMKIVLEGEFNIPFDPNGDIGKGYGFAGKVSDASIIFTKDFAIKNFKKS